MEKTSERVKTTDFAKKLDLELLNEGREYITFNTINYNRPGIELTGFYQHFPAERAQIIGEQEEAFLKSLTPEERKKCLDDFFSHDMACTVMSTALDIPEVVESAIKYNQPLFRSSLRTTPLCLKILSYLSELLAPTLTMHGVLMDLYGVGVLIIGNSGVGKSETAVELVQRGHRLVADDAVIIKKVYDRLIGSSPDLIKYFMEVRGIGIIDVRTMYGVGAVKDTKAIDMIVEIEPWDNNKTYDRLGLVQETREILGLQIPIINIPIKPGRNLAVILEVAARNQRLKSMGYFSAEEMCKRVQNNN